MTVMARRPVLPEAILFKPAVRLTEPAAVRYVRSTSKPVRPFGTVSLLQARLIELNLPINVAVGTRD
jgi:hypothetical protein